MLNCCCNTFIDWDNNDNERDTTKMETIMETINNERYHEKLPPLGCIDVRNKHQIKNIVEKNFAGDKLGDIKAMIKNRKWLDFLCLSCLKYISIPKCSGYFYCCDNNVAFDMHDSPFSMYDEWVNSVDIYKLSDYNDHISYLLYKNSVIKAFKEISTGDDVKIPEEIIVLNVWGACYSVWLWVKDNKDFPINPKKINMNDYYESGKFIGENKNKKGICNKCLKSWDKKGLIKFIEGH